MHSNTHASRWVSKPPTVPVYIHRRVCWSCPQNSGSCSKCIRSVTSGLRTTTPSQSRVCWLASNTKPRSHPRPHLHTRRGESDTDRLLWTCNCGVTISSTTGPSLLPKTHTSPKRFLSWLSMPLLTCQPQVSPVSPLTVGIGRGCTDILMNTISRGRSRWKRAVGPICLTCHRERLFFQMPSAQIPGASAGDIKSPGRMETTPSWPSLPPSQWVMPAGTGATEIPKDTSGMRGNISTVTPQSLSPSLAQLFRSFPG